jgi:hypothetical protein
VWHIILLSQLSGPKVNINPLTDVAVVMMPGPSEFGITNPEQAAAFEGARDITGVPIAEHRLNNYARQYLDVYAMVLAYRVSIVDNQDVQTPAVLTLPSTPSFNQPSIVQKESPNSTIQADVEGSRQSRLNSGFQTYTNSRYGFRVDYPESFVAQQPPVNGDGLEFRSADRRASLVTWGMNNAGFTLQDQFDSAIKDVHGVLGYNKMEKSWFVVTWTNGDTMGYTKEFVGTGSQNAFTFTFPVEQRLQYDSIVTTIEKSFNPGDVESSH